jgi:hypothetical protein
MFLLLEHSFTSEYDAVDSELCNRKIRSLTVDTIYTATVKEGISHIEIDYLILDDHMLRGMSYMKKCILVHLIYNLSVLYFTE